jgi:hypothetical protein
MDPINTAEGTGGAPTCFLLRSLFILLLSSFLYHARRQKNPREEFLLEDVSESSADDGMWFALSGAYLLWSCSLSWHVLLTGLVALFGVLSIGLMLLKF